MDNKQREISEDLYYEMLEVLPPAFMDKKGFQVGEVHDYTAEGLPRYASYTHKDGKYYYRGNLTTPQFKSI